MPCPMCLGAVFWARIKTVYYSASEDDAARGGFDDKLFYEMLDGKKSNLDLKRIDAKDGAKLFDAWLKKNDREVY